MRTQVITVCCVLSLASSALARNPTTRLHGGDGAALAAARMQVTCKPSGDEDFPENPHYYFEIWAWVPDGYHSLDATLSVGNDEGLLTHTGWRSSEGKCVAGFTLGEQALAGAWFQVQWWSSDPIESGGWGAAGIYFLKLSEFTGGHGAAPIEEEFEITTPIESDGPALTIAAKRKQAVSNHLYDLRVWVAGRSDQQFEVRNGQPITRHNVRLADLNGDGHLEIMIVGGTNNRGKEWYKTLLYNEEKQEYRWLAE